MNRNIKVRVVISVLESNGFKKNGGNSHGDFYKHSDGRFTTIGRHYKNRTVPSGTLRSIRKQTNLNF